MMIVRYLLVGGAAAIVDITIFAVSVKGLGLDWFLVAIYSFILATSVNYWLSIRYVFESSVRFKKRVEVSLVFLVSGVGLVINQIMLWLFIETADLEALLSKVMATGTVFIWNYSSRRHIIFKSLDGKN